MQNVRYSRTRVTVPLVFVDGKVRTKTMQSFKKECDVNNIMQKFEKTGVLVDPAKLSNRRAVFADVSFQGTFQDVLHRINNVSVEFGRLSAELRRRFNNSPGELLDFMADPANKAEAVKLGLMEYTEAEKKAIADKAIADNKKAEEEKAAATA